MLTLVTDQCKVHYRSVADPTQLHPHKSSIIWPPKGKFLIVVFALHTENGYNHPLLKEAVARDIGVLYVCDVLPKYPMIDDHVIYVETGWKWFVHMLFKHHPLRFRGVMYHGKNTKIVAYRFSQFTDFTIPIIETTDQIDKLSKRVYETITTKRAILIETMDGIGDILMTFPSAQTLSVQGWEVSYIAPQDRHGLFTGLNFIKKVYTDRSQVNFLEFGKFVQLSYRLSQYSSTFCQQHRLYASADLIGVRQEELVTKKPTLYIAPEEKQWAKALLPKDRTSVLLGWHSYASNRTYPKHAAQQLAFSLIRSGYHVVNTTVEGSNLEGCMNLGRLSLRELLALVYGVNYVICVDTGILHIAGALDKPTIALMSTIPAKWRCSTYPNCYPLQAKWLGCCPCWDFQRVTVQDRACFHEGQMSDPKCLQELTPKFIERVIKKLGWKA